MSRFRRWFGPNAAEILDEAIKRAARLRGELAELNMRVHYYSLLVVDTDHEEDWWRYADLKQKWHDACEDSLEMTKHAVEAEAQVKSLITHGENGA